MRLRCTIPVALVMSMSTFGQGHAMFTFAGGGAPVNVPGTSAFLGAGPVALAVDRTGNVFFRCDNTVLRLDAMNGIITLAAGIGTGGFSGENGPAALAQLNAVTGLAVDAGGSLYISDAGN